MNSYLLVVTLVLIVFSVVTFPVGTSVVIGVLDPLSVDKFVVAFVVFVVSLVTVFLLAQPAAETTAATTNSIVIILKIFFIIKLRDFICDFNG